MQIVTTIFHECDAAIAMISVAALAFGYLMPQVSASVDIIGEKSAL